MVWNLKISSLTQKLIIGIYFFNIANKSNKDYYGAKSAIVAPTDADAVDAIAEKTPFDQDNAHCVGKMHSTQEARSVRNARQLIKKKSG